eukprot:3064484-Rhodomonas_salina.3
MQRRPALRIGACHRRCAQTETPRQIAQLSARGALSCWHSSARCIVLLTHPCRRSKVTDLSSIRTVPQRAICAAMWSCQEGKKRAPREMCQAPSERNTEQREKRGESRRVVGKRTQGAWDMHVRSRHTAR